MDNINFDINEALKLYMSDPATIPTSEADSGLFDCENDPEALTNGVINPVLNPIIDAVAENPDAITRSAHFDSLQFLLKCAPTSLSLSLSPSRPPSPSQFLSSRKLQGPGAEASLPLPTPEPTPPPETRRSVSAIQDTISKLFQQSRYTSFLPTHALSKLFDLITSGLATEADIIQNDLESDEQDLISHHKQLLEIYGFLLQWTISCVETKAAEKSSAAPIARGRKPKGKKAAAADKEANWDSAAQLQTALDTMCKVLRLKLGKIFLTTSERDTFIGLLTRPVYLILESEQRVKNTTIRMHAFKVLCIAVKHHGHGYGRRTEALILGNNQLTPRKPHRSPSSRTLRTSSICRNPWPSSFISWRSNMTTHNLARKYCENSVTRNLTVMTPGGPNLSLPS